jgi:Subtilase family
MKVACLAALVGAALCAAPASAATTPQPPMILPGDATASSLRAAENTWIVGARPTAAAQAIAERFGARQVGPDGTGGYVIGRGKARAFAAALGRLLVYAQPDTLAHSLAVPNDPLSATPYNWRALVADPALTPPPVGPTSPLIALIDAQLDKTHPEFATSNTNTIPTFSVTNPHGTATASVAAAPQNGVGIVGVWPNARALNLPLPDQIKCSDSANQIERAIQNRAAVINMSYASTGFCMPEYVAIQFAVARGIVPVAAAGNEFAEGNPAEFPASLPHVLTAAAVDQSLKSAFFSNANAAIDLAAPGVNVTLAVPPAFDTADGTRDGFEAQSGTSFSAPMVAAAVAWVKAARPTLSGDQLNQAVRLSATDIGNPGWDPDTGFGLLSVANALQIATPPRDPGEPNDDIVWVDGRAFGKPDRLFYKGRGRKRLVGLLDLFEDPGDVYRIRLRPHSRAKVRVKPAGNDDVALYAFKKKAKQVRRKRALKKASHRRRGGTERFVLRNRTGRKQIYYLAIEVQPKARDLDAIYTLRVG